MGRIWISSGFLVLASALAALAQGEPPAEPGFGLQEGNPVPTISRVVEGTAAAEMGLQPGDIIVEAVGAPVANLKDLLAALKRKSWSAGDTLAMKVRRGEQVIEVSGKLKPRAERPARPSVVGKKAKPWTIDRWGNLPGGEKPPTLESLKGKVAVWFCFQSW